MELSASLTIEGWTIDANRFCIARDGIEKKLEPRSMELLLYLAERRGEVVTRQQIEDDVWQGRVVGYDALSGSVAKIRKAFADDRMNPRIIETIPKAGYRLIAEVIIESNQETDDSRTNNFEEFERKLSVILYADVAEYSRLTGEDEDRTHRQLSESLDCLSSAIVEFEGRIVHYAGDAMLAEFVSASMALQGAIEAQQKIDELNSHLAKDKQVLFRIGINIGEVIVDGDEIYGDGVNVAAGLQDLASPGGVYISGAVFDAIGQKQNFEFEFLGERAVKNIQRPISTYAVHFNRGVGLAESVSPVPSNASTRLFSKLRVLVVAIVIIIAVGLYLFDSRVTVDRTDSLPVDASIVSGDPSLAVMPFKSLSNDPEQQFYSDGLTDDLITDLSNIKGLRVIPRHTSHTVALEDLSPREFARKLRVRYIVQGSVRRSFEEIRVNIQMIDSMNDQEIWAQRFDDDIRNVFKLQDQIVRQIIQTVGLESTNQVYSMRGTTNLEAYDYFLRAEHRRQNDTGLTRDSKTIDLYRKAINLDPGYVNAYTGLAREAMINWQLDANQVMPPAVSRKLVYESAGKALKIQPDNAEALSILGLLQAMSGEQDAALQSIERAVAINSSNPQLHVDHASVLSYLGNHEQALNSINKAFELVREAPPTYFIERAKIYFFLGQHQDALDDSEFGKSIRDSRNFELFIHGANASPPAGGLAVRRLEGSPWVNQQYYKTLFAYYRRPQDIKLIVDSAASAGIPRSAYSFDPGDNKALEGSEIRHLANAGLWHGTTHSGNEFFQQFTHGSRVATRTRNLLMSGPYQIDGNKLCVNFQSALLELPDCGQIYRDTESGIYNWVTLGETYRFSVENELSPGP